VASRIVATFSPDDVKAMGPRFAGLREALTPLLNTLAGEVVFWAEQSDGSYLVLASHRPPPAVYRWTVSGRGGSGGPGAAPVFSDSNRWMED
jgi:hypothetical protein